MNNWSITVADVLNMHVHVLQIFESYSVREGNLSQVVVISNELPNPIQLNIETLSRHEIKCTCKFNLSVVS